MHVQRSGKNFMQRFIMVVLLTNRNRKEKNLAMILKTQDRQTEGRTDDTR